MRVGRPTKSQVMAAALLPLILLVLSVLYVIVILCQGRPFLYRSERMRDVDTAFQLLKIRTMKPVAGAREMVMGGPQQRRITAIGHVLRRTRLDELPQIFNVLRGEIVFIGPRPPLRRHVEHQLEAYGALFQVTSPGITGLSTVMLHRREERLLSKCRSERETEEFYLLHCLPRKLRLDLLYVRRRSAWLDAVILWRTILRLFQWKGPKDQTCVPPVPMHPVRGHGQERDLSIAA
ncbi:MAG: sugar transferase [Pseudomonadota bacterium]